MFAPAHLRAPSRDRAILTGSLVAIAVSAWLALWLWEGSPYGHFLHHDGLGGAVGTSLAIGATAFTVGWTLMIVAMMLPSSVPLVVTFGALVSRRAGRCASWRCCFSATSWSGRRSGWPPGPPTGCVHAAVEALPWLAAHPELIIAATLLAAGLWQFSPLRDRCLDECRSPLGFVLNRWRGTSERREALLMGIAHGAFCVGCCWSLMLVMFGVGISSLSGMLVLGGLTAIEKNLPQGRRLTRPLGVALVLAAVYAVAA